MITFRSGSFPKNPGLPPSYEQRTFPTDAADELRLVAAADGRLGAVTVHQDVALYAGVLKPGTAITHPLARDDTPGCTSRAAK